MHLSPRFTLQELTQTSQKHLLEQNRQAAKEYINELTLLCNYILEPARALLKTPLIITSGYRCSALNSAVGGSSTSQHTKGQAADFVPRGISVEEAFKIIKTSGLISYGQLIGENGWIHISLGAPFRPLDTCLQAFKL